MQPTIFQEFKIFTAPELITAKQYRLCKKILCADTFGFFGIYLLINEILMLHGCLSKYSK